MGLFNKMKEPVFLKESSDARRQLEVLKKLEPGLTPEGQEKIRQDMRYLEYGIQGEEQIAFELKNSHMPMYILHDIYLEQGDLSAQIDYLVVTRKICFVLECKNLYGNIEINSNGDFIRAMEFGRYKKKEGIYSPITQNERHLELLKKLKTESRSGLIQRFMTERYFEDFHKSVVVLANPKTILNARYAKKEVKDKVIRADQLVSYIREQYRLSKEAESSDERLKEWAESFLKFHIEVEKDYTEKYRPYLLPAAEEKPVEQSGKESEKCEDCGKCEDAGTLAEAAKTETPVEMISKAEEEIGIREERESGGISGKPEEENPEDSPLFQALKAYRLQKSRKEQVKPYFLYNNSQLKDLMDKMPSSKEELQKVAGFGPVKAEKYGEDILEILSHYR